MTNAIPAEVLRQHIAILGKTGSGKTSTAKLAVEHIAAGVPARICILDPIKSDWWGLTSSADGKRPGLPFHILGGPRGHVPLHPSSGKAIGELVASGALPLSIIDMADFGPGGHAQFFNDFVPTLLRRMRGVVHLVIEEAHIFAPKERSGIGAETMAIHWAKQLGTSGRSKGIRMMVLTQRTQALHNAVLGSCDTLIAHRFTAPADQEPIIKWLKANVSKDIMEKVAASLSSLKTGEGWICSGEAKLFELRHFPRIKTFDNSATPIEGQADVDVKTAPVDQDKLRAIIGDAVKEAESNDPKALKARISDLERDRDILRGRGPGRTNAEFAAEYTRGREDGFEAGRIKGRADALTGVVKVLKDTREHLSLALSNVDAVTHEAGMAQLHAHSPIVTRSNIKIGISDEDPRVAHQTKIATSVENARDGRAIEISAGDQGSAFEFHYGGSAGGGKTASVIDKPMPRAILTTLAQHPEGLTKGQILVHTGYRSSGPVSSCFADLSRNEWVSAHGKALKITDSGLAALGDYEPLPTGAALRKHLLEGDRCTGMEKAMLRVLFDVYPDAIAKGAILELTGYKSSGPVSSAFAHLVALGYAKAADRGQLRASEELWK